MKKLVALALSAATLLTGAFALTSCDDGKITIGVLQYAEHSSLDNCYDGILQGLEERGYSKNEIEIDFKNAKAVDSDNTAYASSIINSMPDVAVGIATPSAYALASAAKGDIPVVFTAVSDPVGSGFNDFDNVTGSSDKLPLDAQLKLITSCYPHYSIPVRVGIIYTRTELNSVSQIAELEAMASTYNVVIESVGIDNASEISTAVDSLIAKGVDCINNLTDNTVVQNLQTVLDRANAAGIPVFGSEVEQVEKGCIASCSLDYVDLGKQTGYMIADILDGKNAGDIDYLFIEDFTVNYNSDVLDEFKHLCFNTDNGVDVAK